MSLSRRRFVQLMTSTGFLRFTTSPLAIVVISSPSRADGGVTLALAIGAIIASRIAAHNARSVELIVLKDLQKKVDLLLDGNLALLRGQETMIRKLAELPGEIAKMLEDQETATLINRLRGVQTATTQVVRLLKTNGYSFMGLTAPQKLVSDALDELNRARNILYSTDHAYRPAVLAIIAAAALADLQLLNLRDSFESGWSKVAEDLIDNVYLPWFQRATDELHPMGLPAYRRKAEADRKATIDEILKTRIGKPLFEGEDTILGSSIITIDEAPEYHRFHPGRHFGSNTDLWQDSWTEDYPAQPRKKDRIWFDVTLNRIPVEQTELMHDRLSEIDADLVNVPSGTAGIEWLSLSANNDKPFREMVTPSAAFPSAVPKQTVTLHVNIPDDAQRIRHMMQHAAWTNATIELAALTSSIDAVNEASARIGLANQVEASVKQSIEHLTRIRRTYA